MENGGDDTAVLGHGIEAIAAARGQSYLPFREPGAVKLLPQPVTYEGLNF